MKLSISYNPAIPLIGIYPIERCIFVTSKDPYKNVQAALLAGAKKQPKYSRIDKLYNHTMEKYTAMKMNKLK